MSELTKTLSYIGTAVVVLVVAWFSRPAPATFDTATLQGESIFEFDPLTARRLRVVSFNSLTGQQQEFEVAQIDNTWSIPSKEGYPADAEDRMAEAANAANGKEVLRVASEDAADHQLYGVLDPTDSGRKLGDEGVGTRVTIEDESGKTLADLIIGKEDKDAPDQRYVRQAGRDIVLVAEIDPEKFSTSFEDWIEKDLLKLSTWDIAKVQIKDYTFDVVTVLTNRGIEVRPSWEHRSDMTLAYNDTDAKWMAASMLSYDPASKQYVENPLEPDQELNSETLNDLKNALGDLRIVDVGKKPAGLSSDLKASEDFLQTSNEEALTSLISHGFAPVQNQDGSLEITSTNGEAIVTMDTGVEYILRFGDVQRDEDGNASDSTTSTETDPADAEEEDNLNRYLFVLARFNEDAIEKPELEDVPDLPPGLDEKQVEETSDPSSESNEGATEDSNAADPQAGGSETDDGSQADQGADEGQESGENDGTESELEQILAERKRIEEANQRKLDEYADKVKKGKESVQELNDRFGDWFYVVDDSEFKRIHLNREQIVQIKEADEDSQTEGGDDGSVDAAGFGRPGEAIPGLPNLPNLFDAEEASPTEDSTQDASETEVQPQPESDAEVEAESVPE